MDIGLALLAVLFVFALPLMGMGVTTFARTLFVSNFAFWLIPLALLQRRWWRQRLTVFRFWALILVSSFLMVLLGRFLNIAVQVGLAQFPWDMLIRGLETPWLALLVYAALHAVVAYAWDLRAAQAMARDAELRALRLQLQPHFLFNTLNAISAQIGTGQLQAAQMMLARLAEFLRATLENEGSHVVSLAQEFAFAEGYLDIEKTRLGRKLLVEWQIGAGVLDCLVPNLLLQPLLENAIRHGIALRPNGGEIEVSTTKHDNKLVIQIENDIASQLAEANQGIGLKNLEQRLQQLYGDAAKWSGGIVAGRYHLRVELPFRTPSQVDPESGSSTQAPAVACFKWST